MASLWDSVPIDVKDVELNPTIIDPPFHGEQVPQPEEEDEHE